MASAGHFYNGTSLLKEVVKSFFVEEEAVLWREYSRTSIKQSVTKYPKVAPRSLKFQYNM